MLFGSVVCISNDSSKKKMEHFKSYSQRKFLRITLYTFLLQGNIIGKFIKSSVKCIRLRDNFVWGVKWKYKFKEITVQPFLQRGVCSCIFDG